MQCPACKIVAFLSLFIATVISQQPADNDYSQMFMVCSPVYSRYELQKIMETSINSLAFQIPVNPLQKLKVSSLSKLNSNLNEIPILQNSNPLPASRNQSSSGENIKENIKHPTTTRQPERAIPERESPTTTVTPTELPTTTTVPPRIEPVSSTTQAPAVTTTTSPTTTTPDVISTTSQASSTLPSSTSNPLLNARPVRARPSVPKRYTNYYRPFPTTTTTTTTFVPNTVISTTELPSIELNPQNKPALAKIRSRLFNLFQPRPFNSNILHKPRAVDYPTLTPQSLFSLNSNSVIQPQATSTSTGRPAASNRLIYSSTESYPQIQSSLLPQSGGGGEQSKMPTSTSSPVDGLMKTKEDLNDKSKNQPTNDNLLAVASSSRFHSVLNSNQEKVADKLEKAEKIASNNEPIKEETIANKQSEDKLNDKADDLRNFKNANENASDNLKESNQKQAPRDKEIKEEATLTGPLNLDEIFSDFGEPANETSTASSMFDKETNKESAKTDKAELKPDQVSSTSDQAVHNEPPTESSVDESDGLIVRKISDVIESISDEPNEKSSLNDGLDAGDKQDPRAALLTDQSDSKSSTKDNDPQDKPSGRPFSEGHSKSDDNLDASMPYKQPADQASKPSDRPDIEESNKFIEVVTTGRTIDRSAEDRAKKERLTREKLMKSLNEKSLNERPSQALRQQSVAATVQAIVPVAKSANDKSISYRLESDKLPNDRSDKPLSDRTESVRVESDKIVNDKFSSDKSSSDKSSNDKSAKDKAMNERSEGGRPAEVTERFVEDTPDDPTTTIMSDYETTTARIDGGSRLNAYTYPIEYMI